MSVDYSYYSDSQHNYLIIQCPENTSDYQYRMIAVNHIKGLITCSLRSIDGLNFLYYDITSHQSMDALFEDREIDPQMMRGILYGLVSAMDSLAHYLLDASRLLLHPELIFFNYETGQYRFLYYPEETDISTFHVLAGFLAGRVKPDDREVAAGIYRLYELSENPNFLLSKSVLDREIGEGAIPEPEPEPAYAAREGKRMEADDFPPAQDLYDDYGDEEELPDDSERLSEEMEEGHKKLGRIMFLSIFFLCLAIILEVIRRVLPLDETTELLDRAGMVSFLAFAIITAFYGTWLSRKTDRTENELEERQETVRNRNRQVLTNEYSAVRILPGYADGPKPEYIGETPGVYAAKEPEGPGKLYGQGSARRYRVDLENLPCTVGTLKGFCDLLIADPSVSGLHTRFFEDEEGKICMEDLNSTAGTFLNGRRLIPKESVVIMRGDEVKIGEIVFYYQ